LKASFLKLDDAAERLGCHIETLRLRIRSGRLKAVRGPHGAYFISGRSLAGLRVHRLRPRQKRHPTASDREAAWDAVARRLRREPSALEELLPFIRILRKNRAANPRAYRLLLAAGLQEKDFAVGAIAEELGVSPRHARRLVSKGHVSAATRAAHRWAQVEARRLVAELRAGLQAEGFQFHKWVMRGRRRLGPPTRQDRPRPAFKVKRISPEEKVSLRRAGLSAEQIWAIGIVGMGSDELNELLLRGLR
jgi:hypothetical protein